MAQDFLDSGIPPTHILAVQFDELASLRIDEPVLRIVDWYERAILGKTLNEASHAGEPTYVVLDEIQNLPNWAPQLKFLADHAATSILVSGSSALRIEAGRDSLAGRITSIELGTLSLTEIAPFYQDHLAQRVLQAGVGAQRIQHYLRFLDDSLLVRLVWPLEIRLKHRRGQPRICLADHALRARDLDGFDVHARQAVTGATGYPSRRRSAATPIRPVRALWLTGPSATLVRLTA